MIIQAKTKSVLILFSTLLIGALIGILLFGWFMRDRMRPIPHPRHFVRSMERMLDPQTEEERQVLRAVLKRHGDRLRMLHDEHREALRVQMDSVRAELAPLLSEEQLRHLDRRRERFGKLMRPWRDRQRE